MKQLIFYIGLFFSTLHSFSQISCDPIAPTIQQWELRMDKLNTHDPELISLHYLFLQDIRNEMEQLRLNELRTLPHCTNQDYYLTKALFTKALYRADTLQEILAREKNRVDQIFYERAETDMEYGDVTSALYNLDRALQYNKYQANALLLKAKLMLAQDQYQESVVLIHQLYTHTKLNDAQESAVSDFTLELYDYLYNKGNDLAQSGLAADALEVFLALEHFCSNMPSGYCNDDYYRGILLSKKGVYDSYIAIAKEAEQRHNLEMAKKFYRYADEYRKNNQ